VILGQHDLRIGEGMLDRFHPAFAAVLKVGNFHGGYGKARPRDAEEWADIKDLTFVTEDYVTVEAYVDYVRDIRCLAIGEQMWAMARHGRFWKANTATEHYEMLSPPNAVRNHTARAMAHFQADILGLDFLETPDGTYRVLESNDTPGLAGFPDEVRHAVARLVRRKMET
jgi:ribosomal protein S6--L-glutamate ligase